MTGCRAWLVAGIAVVVVAGCGPTGAPDVVSGDAGPVTGSTPRFLAQTTAAKARVAALRRQFRVPVVQPDLQLPGRGVPAHATRAVIGPSMATEFRLVGTDAMRPELPDGAKRAVLKSAAVTLPTRADGTTRVEDDTSHVAVAFTLRGATDAPISATRGIAVYARALPDADVIHRPSAEGTEDYVAFDSAPAREELVYDVDVSRAAGLRLVANTLEFLDKEGAPRLRVAPPMVIDAAGKSNAATLTVEGCAFDKNPKAPWGRAVTAPVATRCGVRVAWSAVTYPVIVDRSWVATGSMATARMVHSMSVLGSGLVLVAGGGNGSLSPLSPSAELYDPASGTFSATGSMAMARWGHTASVLGSGKVLLAGGILGGNILASAELYDPASGMFSVTGSMVQARFSHTASVLGSGKVLVAGGDWGGAISSAEVARSGERDVFGHRLDGRGPLQSHR